jgi:putative transposase
MSDMGGRIGKDESGVWVVRTRAVTRPAQHRVMAGYAGSTRAIYNVVLFRLRGAWRQLQAEETYGVPEGERTGLVPWSFEGMSAHYRAHRDTLIPWHRDLPSDVQEFAVRAVAAALDTYRKGTARFPTPKKRFGIGAGLVPFSVKDQKTTWLADGGRTVRLPFAAGSRLPTVDRGRLRDLRLVANNRMRRAARLVREGRAQVQQVTFSFEGGYWWAAVRFRACRSTCRRR